MYCQKLRENPRGGGACSLKKFFCCRNYSIEFGELLALARIFFFEISGVKNVGQRQYFIRFRGEPPFQLAVHPIKIWEEKILLTEISRTVIVGYFLLDYYGVLCLKVCGMLSFPAICHELVASLDLLHTMHASSETLNSR